MKRHLPACFVSAALLSLSLAQEPAPPRPPEPGAANREARPPLPPGEQRERPPGGPEGERPPFPPPGGERRPEGFPPRDGERSRGPEGRRFEGERRGDQNAFPGSERAAQQRMKPTPYLGVVSSAASPALGAQLGLGEGFGLVVEEVLPESPAASAGVQRFDVLKQLNEQQLIDPAQLGTLVRGLGKDAEVTLTLIRKGQEQKLTVKIGEKMLPERRSEEWRGSFGSPENRRGSDMSRGFSDMGREVQERMRALQERMRDYQRAMTEWQEKMRAWQEKREGEMPKPPPFPMLDTPRERPSGAMEPGRQPNPPDLLQDPRSTSSAHARVELSDGTSRWDTSRARVTMRDREGEVELAMKDGKRTLTVKNPAGDTVFTGPVDTPDQRNAVPEPFRGKLNTLEVAPQSQPPIGEGFRAERRPAEPSFTPQPRVREPEVQ